MSRKSSAFLTVAGAAIVLFAPSAVSQQMPQTTKKEIAGTPTVRTEQLSGTVVVVEGNKLVVRMSSGDIRYFEPPESRRFVVDGEELTLQQLKPGTRLQATVTTTVTPVMERTTTIGSGRVWYVSGNTLIVTLPNNENRSFKVDDSYRFTVAGQPASVHDLKKGMVINAQKIVEQPKSTFASNVAVTGQAPPAPQPRQVAQNRTLAPAPQPAPAPSPAATPAPAPAPEPAPAQAPALPRKLPDTASPFPLAGVAGLLLVAASFGVRAFRH